MRAILFSVLLLLFATQANNVKAEPLERPAATTNCDDSKRICSYVAQNITGSELISRITKTVFGGIPLSGSEHGYLETISHGSYKIVFYHDTLLKQIIEMIPLLDRNEEFSPRSIVQVTAEIYALEETGMTNLKASIDSISLSPLPGLDTGVTTNGDDLNLKFNVGGVGLSTALRASRIRQELETVTRFYAAVSNMETVAYENYIPVFYQFPGTTTGVKQYNAGLGIKGTVSISHDDPDMVILRDGGLEFGIASPEGDKVATFLSMSMNNVFFRKGVAAVLVSSNTSMKFKKNGGGLLRITHDSENRETSLVVVLTMTPVSFETYLENMKDMVKRNSVHPVLTAEEVRTLPREGSLQRIFETLKPIAIPRADGNVLLGFNFDKDVLSQENYDKRFTVKVKGRGLSKVNAARQVQNVALGRFTFPNLRLGKMDRAEIRYHVTLEERNVVYPAVPIRKEYDLMYNPDTNDFYIRPDLYPENP